MNLTLVRHTSVAVEKGICYGQSDVGLKDTFEQEATAVKQQLKGRHFDFAYMSPLSRCVRLAAFCGFGSAKCDSRLMELDFGDWEMQPFDKISDPRLQLWYDDYINVAPTGGESFMDQRKRVESFLCGLSGNKNDSIIIFTHGGVILQFLLLCGKITPDKLFDSLPQYGEVVEIRGI